LSIALSDGGGIFFSFFCGLFGLGGFVGVIDEFLFIVLLFIAHAEFEFALLGPEHDGLTVHAADHVEGRLGFAAQGQLQEVVLDARLNGFTQGRLDLKEAVGRTKAFNALMGAFVVVVFDPESDPVPGGLEALELGPDQEVLPEGGPETFDLAQGHGMLGAALDVGHPVLLELGLETAGAPPAGVLAAVVSEHLLGGTELARGGAINLDHRLGGGAAEQISAHHEPGVIVQEGNQVGVAAPQSEGEDVRLPHLVGGGPFEEARAGHVGLLFGLLLGHQVGLVQPPAHRLRAGGHEELSPQPLADALDPEVRMLLAQLDDLAVNRLGQLVLARWLRSRLQPRFSQLPVELDPAVETAGRHAQLDTHILGAEALLQAQPDGFELQGRRIGGSRFFGATPPRGGEGSLLPLPLYYDLLSHVNTPSNFGVSTHYPFISVSRSGR
jgi:hypothetical protein